MMSYRCFSFKVLNPFSRAALRAAVPLSHDGGFTFGAALGSSLSLVLWTHGLIMYRFRHRRRSSRALGISPAQISPPSSSACMAISFLFPLQQLRSPRDLSLPQSQSIPQVLTGSGAEVFMVFSGRIQFHAGVGYFPLPQLLGGQKPILSQFCGLQFFLSIPPLLSFYLDALSLTWSHRPNF